MDSGFRTLPDSQGGFSLDGDANLDNDFILRLDPDAGLDDDIFIDVAPIAGGKMPIEPKVFSDIAAAARKDEYEYSYEKSIEEALKDVDNVRKDIDTLSEMDEAWLEAKKNDLQEGDWDVDTSYTDSYFEDPASFDTSKYSPQRETYNLLGCTAAYVNYDIDKVRTKMGLKPGDPLTMKMLAEYYDQPDKEETETKLWAANSLEGNIDGKTGRFPKGALNDSNANDWKAGGFIGYDEAQGVLKYAMQYDDYGDMVVIDQVYNGGNSGLVLFNPKTNEIFVSIQGTGSREWPSNWTHAAGGETARYDEVIKFSRDSVAKVLEMYPGLSEEDLILNLSGHSNGGNGALAAAIDLQDMACKINFTGFDSHQLSMMDALRLIDGDPEKIKKFIEASQNGQNLFIASNNGLVDSIGWNLLSKFLGIPSIYFENSLTESGGIGAMNHQSNGIGFELIEDEDGNKYFPKTIGGIDVENGEKFDPSVRPGFLLNFTDTLVNKIGEDFRTTLKWEKDNPDSVETFIVGGQELTKAEMIYIVGLGAMSLLHDKELEPSGGGIYVDVMDWLNEDTAEYLLTAMGDSLCEVYELADTPEKKEEFFNTFKIGEPFISDLPPELAPIVQTAIENVVRNIVESSPEEREKYISELAPKIGTIMEALNQFKEGNYSEIDIKKVLLALAGLLKDDVLGLLNSLDDGGAAIIEYAIGQLDLPDWIKGIISSAVDHLILSLSQCSDEEIEAFITGLADKIDKAFDIYTRFKNSEKGDWGTKLGLIFEGIELVSDFVRDEVTDLLNGLVKLLVNNESIPKIIRLLIPKLAAGLQFALNSLANAATAITGFANDVKNLFGDIKDFWSNLFESGDNIAEIVAKTLGGIVYTVAVTSFTVVLSGIEHIGKFVAAQFKNLTESMFNALLNTWEMLKSIATELWEGIKSFGDNLLNGLKNIGDKIVSTVKSAKEGLENLVDTAKQKAGEAIQWAGDKINQAANKIAETAKNLWDKVIGKATELFEKGKKEAAKLKNTVVEAVKAAVDNIVALGNKIKEKVTNVVNNLVDAFNKIKDAIAALDIPGKLKDVVAGFGDFLIGIGDVLKGIGEGLKKIVSAPKIGKAVKDQIESGDDKKEKEKMSSKGGSLSGKSHGGGGASRIMAVDYEELRQIANRLESLENKQRELLSLTDSVISALRSELNDDELTASERSKINSMITKAKRTQSVLTEKELYRVKDFCLQTIENFTQAERRMEDMLNPYYTELKALL